MRYYYIGLLGFCMVLFQPAVSAEKVAAVEINLVSETEQVVPGETLHLALTYELEPHWHIYWQNPGSSGLPVEIEWTLPEGFEAGEIQWPAPERIELGGLINYGYEDAVTLIVPVQVPETVRVGAAVNISAKVFWLMCKEMCLPGDANLSMELPVAAVASQSPHAAAFTAARIKHPQSEAPWAISTTVEENALVLMIEQGAGPELPQDFYFYAEASGVIDPDMPQLPVQIGKGVIRLELPLASEYEASSGASIRGVLQSVSGNWFVDTTIGAKALATARVGAVPDVAGFEGVLLKLGLPGWLLLAFLGGVILNIMPCVLPVLSLKVFSLLKHSGETRGQALLHGLAYTFGVVASFLVLAGCLFALRAVGDRIGWGFQLQSPNFVVILMVVFFLFALNLMGVFEVGTSLVGADTKVSKRNDVLGSFGMGVLAAVVGAPCMGPLVASVSGIAVQANTFTGLLIFGVMGFGLASPFLLLSIFPKLVAYLPKPGIWMESVKQFMGFLLMAAVVFLALVVGQLGGVNAVIGILITLLICALAAWIYGRWSVPVKSKKTQRVAQLLSALLLILATGYGISETKAGYENYVAGTDVSEDPAWSAWSTERVESELAAGNPVFIDFTAAWCLICQANKKIVLHTEATTALFAEYGITTLEADWTRHDSAITDELERFGRSGVPLYVLYSPDGEVTVLPQSLTNGNVREAVENVLK
jgi:thiol:disulfide interchange protein/DsbC/DsbD-like thiol-disulfide interchange protein